MDYKTEITFISFSSQEHKKLFSNTRKEQFCWEF